MDFFKTTSKIILKTIFQSEKGGKKPFMFHPRLCKCKNHFKRETEGRFLPTWLLVKKEKKKVKDLIP